MILPRMTSSPAKKLEFDSELVTSSRLLVRMITIGGKVNWKTPKMELQVSFLLLNFRNGMFLLFYTKNEGLLTQFSISYCFLLQNLFDTFFALLAKQNPNQSSKNSQSSASSGTLVRVRSAFSV